MIYVELIRIYTMYIYPDCLSNHKFTCDGYKSMFRSISILQTDFPIIMVFYPIFGK